MLNIFEGLKDGRPKTPETSLVLERDLRSGLYGMSLGVGFPASIVAQMMAAGEIAAGVLNPALDVPMPRSWRPWPSGESSSRRRCKRITTTPHARRNGS